MVLFVVALERLTWFGRDGTTETARVTRDAAERSWHIPSCRRLAWWPCCLF